MATDEFHLYNSKYGPSNKKRTAKESIKVKRV